MKIVIFSDNVAPYRIGWADELGKTNDVTFCYVKDKDAERNDNWLVKNSKFAKMVKLPALIINNRAVSFSVVKYLKKNSADVIIFDGYGIIPNILGMMYLILKQRSYYINIDGVRIGHEENLISRFLKRILFNKYSYYLCGSQYAINCLKKYNIDSNHACEHKFTSIYERDIIKQVPTVDQVSTMRKSLGLKDLPTVLAVGRFLKLKQFDSLIRAFSKYDDKYQLVIVGEGEEEQTYRELIRQLSLQNVHIFPFVPFDKLKHYYYSADVLALTSNSEVWGLVINEGMGCAALPIIASDRCVAAFSLIQEEKNGFIYPYDNIDELEKYIGVVLEKTGQERQRMRETSLEIIQDFTIEKLTQRHLCFWERIRNAE